jgi:hypothetical protein
MINPRTLLTYTLVWPLFSHAQWVDIPDPSTTGVGESDWAYFINDQVGFGTLNGCRIARTADGGQNWTIVGDYDDAESNGTLFAIDFDASGMYGVALGYNGFDTDLIGLVSDDGGLTWEDAPDLAGLPDVSVRLEVVAPESYLIGSFLTWALTTNGGQDFTGSYLTSAQNVQFLDAQHVFRLGSSPFAEFGYSSDGGVNWVDHDAPGTTGYLGPSFADPLHGLAVRSQPDLPQVLMRTTDGAVTWEPVLTCPTTTLRMDDDVNLGPDGNGIVVIQNDDTTHVFLSDDFGATWTEHTPADNNIAFVQATTSGAFYLIGHASGKNYWRYTGAVDHIATHTEQHPWTYDAFTSTLWLNAGSSASVRIMDLSGRPLLHTSIREGSPLHLGLVSGMYVLSVDMNGALSSGRLVVP